MKLRYLKISFTVLFGLGLTELQAQETILATGGVESSSTGSVSYSVGQTVYTVNTGIDISITEGVQQPFEISGPTALEEATGILLLVSTYPNPTTDFLILKVENLELSTLSFQLYDIKGMLLENKKIEGIETRITMSNYIPSTYILNVSNGNKELRTFKIIKHE
jgi:hypothetical protein